MEYKFNDGGRAEAGYRGDTRDCVTRAIAIATETPYQVVYDALNDLAKSERTGKKKRRKSSARTGVYKTTYKRYLESLGWKWTPLMQIGSGFTAHLDDNLPAGKLIVKTRRHLVAVIDGVIHDTFDPSYEGRRGVYGYWSQ